MKILLAVFFSCFSVLAVQAQFADPGEMDSVITLYRISDEENNDIGYRKLSGVNFFD